MALSAGPFLSYASIRFRYASTSARHVSRPLFIASWICGMVVSSTRKAGGAAGGCCAAAIAVPAIARTRTIRIAAAYPRSCTEADVRKGLRPDEDLAQRTERRRGRRGAAGTCEMGDGLA